MTRKLQKIIILSITQNKHEETWLHLKNLLNLHTLQTFLNLRFSYICRRNRFLLFFVNSLKFYVKFLNNPIKVNTF